MFWKAILQLGKPASIRCDNGPEISSRHFLAWAIERKIDVMHIRPGKPTENADLESFHGRFRDECLSISRFWILFDAPADQNVAAGLKVHPAPLHTEIQTPNESASQLKAAWPSSARDMVENKTTQEGEAAKQICFMISDTKSEKLGVRSVRREKWKST